MKSKRVLPIFITVIWFCVTAASVEANSGAVQSQLLVYAGKSYRGIQDPEYLSYDLIFRNYLVGRIQKRFGIALDPKTYSGFDLLEIEAFFKCKKSEEPFDIFLKMFAKRP
jgi:hypothetical protein